MTKTDRIIELAQEAATKFGVFQRRGPGEGNRVTNATMAHLNGQVEAELGNAVVEPALGSGAKQSVDVRVVELKANDSV